MVTSIRTRLAVLLLGIASSGVRAQDLTSAITAAASSVVQSATGTSTSSAAAATWTVNVGKLDHVFEPNIITANPGDTVLFNFYPKNHSVVRAEYGYPCVPYELRHPGEMGAWSGFKPVDTVLTNPPTWSLLINDTDPFFFYCSAPGSCKNYQMVGVINPNATTSLQTQKEKAAQVAYALSPGEPIPDEDPNAATSSAATYVYTAPSSTGSPTQATSPGAAVSTDDHGSSFPPGAIAGVVVGGVAIIALAAALFYFVGRHRSVKAREAAGGMLAGGNEKGFSGAHSPASPMPGEPVLGPGGMVYVPAKPMDYNRMSMPPQYPQQPYSPQEAPLNPMTPHSPVSNPHYSTVSTYDMGAHSPAMRSQSPPVEMYTPRQ